MIDETGKGHSLSQTKSGSEILQLLQIAMLGRVPANDERADARQQRDRTQQDTDPVRCV